MRTYRLSVKNQPPGKKDQPIESGDEYAILHALVPSALRAIADIMEEGDICDSEAFEMLRNLKGVTEDTLFVLEDQGAKVRIEVADIVYEITLVSL